MMHVPPSGGSGAQGLDSALQRSKIILAWRQKVGGSAVLTTRTDPHFAFKSQREERSPGTN